MILHWIKQVWWSAWSAWERLSVRICGGLANGRASRGRIFWLSRARQFGGNRNPAWIWRNPEEFGGIQWKYRNSSPAGIPAKNSCKSGWKQEFLRPLQNHVPVNKFCRKKKNGEKNPQESCVFLFFSPKKNSCQTGITNLCNSQNIKRVQRDAMGPIHKSVYWSRQSYKRCSSHDLGLGLLLEEYGPKIVYIKGIHNTIADAISRLEYDPASIKQLRTTIWWKSRKWVQNAVRDKAGYQSQNIDTI